MIWEHKNILLKIMKKIKYRYIFIFSIFDFFVRILGRFKSLVIFGKYSTELENNS